MATAITQLPTPTAPLLESADEAQARIARVEQRMLDAEAVRTAADTSVRETKSVSYTSYEAALAAGREIGASRADDAALMALFCAGPLRTLVGAVSPELVWDGAQRRGLSTRELGRLANSDVMAVSDLQWVDDTPTAPLSPAAAAALARLERTSIAPAVVGAVTVYERAALHAVELSDLAAIGVLSDLDADSLAHAEDLMAGARATLAEAGRLDLIGVAA
jgi:hypothetical protein